eukprot:CAMPEP_0179437200 /NCGR_PEP_ID=MMETSP0799-20121207/21140_1 /TAXON_ID=46947 /ORGANISM="Geminigera cryophila, Strain CCMP2564" /LENGTH=66 /DNA_ID=CAMNT_0021217993 /DNA_START=661 /DNA_END=857 /DNA_ORIENTATION=+
MKENERKGRGEIDTGWERERDEERDNKKEMRERACETKEQDSPDRRGTGDAQTSARRSLCLSLHRR